MIQSEDEIDVGDLLYIDIQERHIFTVSIVICKRQKIDGMTTATTCNSGKYIKQIHDSHGISNWSVVALK